MASVTIEEKRLKQLRQQLFGKEQPLVSQTSSNKSQDTIKLQITKEPQKSKQSSPEATIINPISLRRDFTKIISFSFLALLIQMALYFANKQGLIKFFN